MHDSSECPKAPREERYVCDVMFGSTVGFKPRVQKNPFFLKKPNPGGFFLDVQRQRLYK